MKIVFFGQLRERLNTECLTVNLAELAERKTVHDLRLLLQSKNEQWYELLRSEQSLVAVNQTMSHDEMSLDEDDEIAFFPPVTGG